MRLTELASDLEALRADLAEELVCDQPLRGADDALNADEETRDVVTHLLDEKKQHVAVLLAQLRRLDVKQREKLNRDAPA